MEAAVAKACGQPAPVHVPDLRRPADGWEDMEIFLGKEHQFKNMGAGGGCHDGACTIRKLGSDKDAAIAHPLPLPAAQRPLETAAATASVVSRHPGYVVYGAEWCIFCRRAKLLLASLGIAEAHVDVDDHGGASNVVSQLAAAEDYPLKGIPVIFEAVETTAKVTVGYDRSRLEDRGGKQYREYVCTVALNDEVLHEFGLRYSETEAAHKELLKAGAMAADAVVFPKSRMDSMRDMTNDEANVARRGEALQAYWQSVLSLPNILDHPALAKIVGFDRTTLCSKPKSKAAARLLAGGYAELERELRTMASQGKLAVDLDGFEEAVLEATRESESSVVQYDKNGHSAHVVLGKGWHLEEQCVVVTGGGKESIASLGHLEVDFALGNGATGATLWVVGGGGSAGGAGVTAAPFSVGKQGGGGGGPSVALSGVPANPPRALAHQLQQALGLRARPQVAVTGGGTAIAILANAEDAARADCAVGCWRLVPPRSISRD